MHMSRLIILYYEVKTASQPKFVNTYNGNVFWGEKTCMYFSFDVNYDTCFN